MSYESPIKEYLITHGIIKKEDNYGKEETKQE